MRGKLRQIGPQLRMRLQDPVRQTGKWLQSVVQGYFNYYAVPGNLPSLGMFREPGEGALVAHSASPKPKTLDLLDAHPSVG
jgi:hypothetical protein